ncbi:serine carboxypeptidase-like 18 [Capsicum annuum]|uniref:serine carboxypeptidase-like 18 n=1 Tax=Capsicum annuum TaxID=4072 RepID=UPI001FB09902|nr:serine carboxypeptidase-like 18 [Capsicum annuum]
MSLVANFLFIDSPVGTGFSYARTPADKHSDDLRATYHAYQFLPNWFVDHHEFLNNLLYVGGESYLGRTVPIITQNIAIHNEMQKKNIYQS